MSTEKRLWRPHTNFNASRHDTSVHTMKPAPALHSIKLRWKCRANGLREHLTWRYLFSNLSNEFIITSIDRKIRNKIFHSFTIRLWKIVCRETDYCYKLFRKVSCNNYTHDWKFSRCNWRLPSRPNTVLASNSTDQFKSFTSDSSEFMSIVSSIRANGEPLLCGPPTSIKPSQNSASVSYTLDENEFNQRTALLFQPLNPALRLVPLNFRSRAEWSSRVRGDCSRADRSTRSTSLRYNVSGRWHYSR